MRGENEFQEAYENKAAAIEPVKGTFYGVSPWRRIIVSFAGPFFNFLFAIVVLACIWGVGFNINTLGNRIVLVSDVNKGSHYPADDAGLKTGDTIIAIDGQKTANYHDIQEIIATHPDKTLPVTVKRDGKTLELRVEPSLDKETGAGRIGVYFWTDPVINAVAKGSAADIAGLKPGDRLISANGQSIPYTVALSKVLEKQPPVLHLDYERDGRLEKANMVLSYDKNGGTALGIGYKTLRFRSPSLNPIAALVKGGREAWKTLVVSVQSFGLLFKGIDLTKAVSGPVRITYMMGDAAAEGFARSIGSGISSMANFLALISIALGVMNLLPLPVLDGGMIVLFIIEIIKRKPLRPKVIYAFQTVGVVLIFGLMLFAVFGDILFLAHR
jgi:regulator of sigma E protease